MPVAILIPAKGKSKRIPRKNLQKIGDQTLVERCVEKVLRCSNVDKIYLDTDTQEIVDLCDKYRAQDSRFIVKERNTDLLGDNVGTPEICQSLLRDDESIEYLGIMHVTAPFLKTESIDKCVDMFVTSEEVYDSLFTVEVLRDYIWKDKPLNFNVDCRTSTDSVDVYYKLTGGFFISTRKYILEHKTFIGRSPILFQVPVLEALDINYPNELELARIIHAGLETLKSDQETLSND
jgi:CMP-N-acetylneuraminic acid synthetase